MPSSPNTISPAAGFAFDDAGQRVLISWPGYDGDNEAQEDSASVIRLRTAVAVLDSLLLRAENERDLSRLLNCAGLQLHKAGIEMFGAPRTLRDLAERLHVTEARACQIFKSKSAEIAGVFADISRPDLSSPL